jgi:MFS family permease
MSSPTATEGSEPARRSFDLLRQPAFRAFWIGAVGSNISIWIQATTVAWMVAALGSPALVVGMVQTAISLPALLFGLPAGVLADIADRRRVLLATQGALLLIALTLAALGFSGLAGAASLLVLAAALGTGIAFNMPTQQTLTNELVARVDVPRAVALGAVSFNVARAVGPALAGLLIGWITAGGVLLLSALLYGGMLRFAWQWRGSKASAGAWPAETLLSGVRSGLRYARHSPALRTQLLRTVTFILCASALWSLLPVVARDQLKMGAAGYGLLFSCLGVGAIVGALLMPTLLQRLSVNALIGRGTLLYAATLGIVAVADSLWLAGPALLASGAAWSWVMASITAATATSFPAWIRARALAAGMLVMQGGMALGGLLWGAAASAVDTLGALAAAGALMALGFLLTRKREISLGTEADVTPSAHWPGEVVTFEPSPDDGPILVQIDYHIHPQHEEAFLRALYALGPTRRRDGAERWSVFRNLAAGGHFVERFVVESWAEHQRQRARATMADRELERAAQSYQRPDVSITVSRFLWQREPE